MHRGREASVLSLCGLRGCSHSLMRFRRNLIVFLILLGTISCSTQPRPGDRITIAVPYEFDTLDPQARNTVSNFAMLSHFYEPLVESDAAMTIRPCLAKLWENPDALTWIFYLQPNVKFHDGKALTSEDILYSFHRLLENPKLEMSGFLADISDITAVGPNAVRIHTAHPMNILLNKLRFVPIVPAGSTSEMLQSRVNGTGPYKFSNWEKGKTIVMIRNDEYWRQKPDIAEVVFLLGQTPGSALNLFLSGKCRFAQCNTKELDAHRGKFQVFQNDSLFVKFLGYDLSRDDTPFCSLKPNPFKNKLVRQAINMALDRDSLVSKLPIYASPAVEPLPPFVFGFNPEIRPAGFQVDRAISLLKEAGVPGFRCTLHYRNNLEEAAKIVQEQLLRIGIHLDLKTAPTPDILPALKHHEYSFFLASMGAPSGDASDILDPALHSVDEPRRYGVLNYGRYSNPEVDRAIEQSAQIQVMDSRRDAIQRIMRTVMDDLPWIPLYIDRDTYAVDSAYVWKPRNDSFIFASEIHLR